MKLLSTLLGFLFVAMIFTVILIYSTTVVIYTVDEYLKRNDTNIIIYIQKNNVSEYI